MQRHPLNQPWAISEDGLQLVLAVHSRGELFAERLARARADVADQGRDIDNGSAMIVLDGVAQIPIVGPLFRHASMLTDVSGATSYGDIAKDLRAAVEDPEVRAIILCIDSPGGEAAGCAELAERIRAASAKKPVTAYAEGACCSAAYWLACGAAELVAAPSAWLGSIGVRIAVVDDSQAQEKMGVRRVEIVSSQSPGKRGEPIDDDVLARLQARADELAEIFVSDVARFRGTSTAKVLEDFGQGDVLLGAKAVAAGMADRIGSLDALMAQLSASQTAPAGAQQRTTTMTRSDSLRALGLAEGATKKDISAKLKELRLAATAEDKDPEDAKDDEDPESEDEDEDEDDEKKKKKDEEAKQEARITAAVTAAVQPLQDRLDKLEKKPAQAARRERVTEGGAPRGAAGPVRGDEQAVKDYVKKLWS